MREVIAPASNQRPYFLRKGQLNRHTRQGHKVEGTDQPILRPATTTRKTKHYLLFAKGSVESTLKVPTTRPATTTRNTATQRSCHSVDYTHTGEDLL